MPAMNNASHLQDRASDLVDAARSFQTAAQAPASHAAVPESLAALEDTLQALSAAWYQLAAHASPGVAARQPERASDVPSRLHVDGPSREQEARLIGTLHDVAAAFARCARECRNGRSAVTPIIARGVAAARAGKQPDEADVAWFESRERPTQRVA
jgi:hypothetical protein